MITLEIASVVLVFLKLLIAILAVIFFLSGLDEAFIDFYYFWLSALKRSPRRPNEVELRESEEQPIALMIPAWQESGVIQDMLENNLKTIEYSNYVVFVGTYANDMATRKAVEQVCAKFSNVYQIVCPKPGPTTKADCLGWILQGIRDFELQYQVSFQIFVMNDAEDVLHPLVLKVFNHTIPENDMVQVPVLPEPAGWSRFTAGHYLDEFAENHMKNMVVRERLGGGVPSAGVGCALSRFAITFAKKARDGRLFSTDSLAEDYDLSLRMAQEGLTQTFVNLTVRRNHERTSRLTGRVKAVQVRETIGVRECFPSTFRTATRQKARWVTGIALQAWASLGWRGSLAIKYMLFRDRKCLITNYVNVLGYLVVAIVLLFWLFQGLDPESYRFLPLVEHGSLTWYLLLINTFLLVLRVVQRAYFVGRIYDLGQAALSVPRLVWANLINCVATARAMGLYVRYLWTRRRIPWDKTEHRLPEVTP